MTTWIHQPYVDPDDASMLGEGVYAPSRPRRVLFSEVVEFQTDKLPRRTPRIVSDDSFLAVIVRGGDSK